MEIPNSSNNYDIMNKNQITEIRGDETARYEVVLNKEYNVEEFVKEVLKDTYEWGEIKEQNNWFGKKICSFSKGLRTSRIPEEYKNRKVASAYADGGWSLMTYYLKLK